MCLRSSNVHIFLSFHTDVCITYSELLKCFLIYSPVLITTPTWWIMNIHMQEDFQSHSKTNFCQLSTALKGQCLNPNYCTFCTLYNLKNCVFDQWECRFFLCFFFFINSSQLIVSALVINSSLVGHRLILTWSSSTCSMLNCN